MVGHQTLLRSRGGGSRWGSLRLASLIARGSSNAHERKGEGHRGNAPDVTGNMTLPAPDSGQSQALVAVPPREGVDQGDAVQSSRLGGKGAPSSKQHSGAFRAASRNRSGAVERGGAGGSVDGSGSADGRLSEWKGHERIATFCVLAVILGLRDKFLTSAKGLDDVVNVSGGESVVGVVTTPWCLVSVLFCSWVAACSSQYVV